MFGLNLWHADTGITGAFVGEEVLTDIDALATVAPG